MHAVTVHTDETLAIVSHLHHNLGVGGLHGEKEVVVIVLAANARELEGALNHACNNRHGA
jgi:hypothetical protein